jgi:hypothetical protein
MSLTTIAAYLLRRHTDIPVLSCYRQTAADPKSDSGAGAGADSVAVLDANSSRLRLSPYR